MNFPQHVKFHMEGRTTLFYSEFAQRSNSVANMWHDPGNENLYEQKNMFLPLYNGLLVHDPNNARRKSNFIRLHRAVFLGGTFGADVGDGVVTPAASCRFGFYNDNSTSIMPLQKQKLYREDTLGLRRLDGSGRLVTAAVPHVKHGMWLTDRAVAVEHVLRWLA